MLDFVFDTVSQPKAETKSPEVGRLADSNAEIFTQLGPVVLQSLMEVFTAISAPCWRELGADRQTYRFRVLISNGK